ncbi:Transcription repressor MYB5 [Senna tora]|uniref:Transcription repressor MYB5 n=1 Tax=Senna tora TaxID=362788 RepID=A0A834X251_9FABA|nr:Transcription repressor MYB5 [Senna tora]
MVLFFYDRIWIRRSGMRLRSRVRVNERLMGTGINALADELLTQMCVPIVLYLIIGAEIVHPSETAALAASEEASPLSTSSSSAVHGPLFSPILLQHAVDVFVPSAPAPGFLISIDRSLIIYLIFLFRSIGVGSGFCKANVYIPTQQKQGQCVDFKLLPRAYNHPCSEDHCP